MSASAINRFNNQGLQPYWDAKGSKRINVKFNNSLTLAKGTCVAYLTAAGNKWVAYNNANSDGSEVMRGVLEFDVTVDSSGNHTVAGGEQGETYQGAPVFISGYLKTSELVGLDAAGVTDVRRLVFGTVSDGVLCLTGN